jgi:hypothetical protein
MSRLFHVTGCSTQQWPQDFSESPQLSASRHVLTMCRVGSSRLVVAREVFQEGKMILQVRVVDARPR